MTKSWRVLRMIRRIAIVVIAVMFAASNVWVFTLGRGNWGDWEFAGVRSFNGVLACVSVGSTAGSSNPPALQWKLQRISELEKTKPWMLPPFNWQGLGFAAAWRDLPSSRSTPARSARAVVVPYWAMLFFLLLPELRLLMARVHAGVVSKAVPETKVESSQITSDLPCVHCGYNLRTLTTTALCPECGSQITDTLTLSAELAKSRPAWLKCLAAGNVLVLVSRVMVVVGYLAMSSLYDASFAGVAGIIAGVMYVAGIFLMTWREHPFLSSPERGAALGLRILALASLGLFAAGVTHQMYGTGRQWNLSLRFLGIHLGGGGFWHLPALVMMIGAWILYCVSTVLEFQFLARLAGRLLDDFMIEHCKIAGIGAGISGTIALWLTQTFNGWGRWFLDNWMAGTWLVVMIQWLLFLVWTGFMNVYCAVRFTQQAWLAEERWRRQQANAAPAVK